MTMNIPNLDVLETGEAILAKILVKNKLVSEDAIQKFISLKTILLSTGKPALGGVLIALGYIKDGDLAEFIKENESEHVAFVDWLVKRGFMSQEQSLTLLKENNETKRNISALVNDKNIMTKDFYSKLFSNHGRVLKLGEWLVAKGRVTQERLDLAMAVHKISTLEKFLVVHNYVKETVLYKVKEKAGVPSMIKI